HALRGLDRRARSAHEVLGRRTLGAREELLPEQPRRAAAEPGEEPAPLDRLDLLERAGGEDGRAVEPALARLALRPLEVGAPERALGLGERRLRRALRGGRARGRGLGAAPLGVD